MSRWKAEAERIHQRIRDVREARRVLSEWDDILYAQDAAYRGMLQAAIAQFEPEDVEPCEEYSFKCVETSSPRIRL